jgi:hypothetical protein
MFSSHMLIKKVFSIAVLYKERFFFMCYKSLVRSLFLVTRLAFLVIAFSEDMQSKALEPSLDRQTWISETRSIRSFTSGNP